MGELTKCWWRDGQRSGDWSGWRRSSKSRTLKKWKWRRSNEARLKILKWLRTLGSGGG